MCYFNLGFQLKGHYAEASFTVCTKTVFTLHVADTGLRHTCVFLTQHVQRLQQLYIIDTLSQHPRRPNPRIGFHGLIIHMES